MAQSLTRIGPLLAALATAAILLLPGTAEGRSAGTCDRVGVKLSSQVLVPGTAMRVGGRACARRLGMGSRLLRVEMRGRSRNWRPVGLVRTGSTGWYVRNFRTPRTNRRQSRLRVVGHGVRSRPLRVRFAHSDLALAPKATKEVPGAGNCPLALPGSEIDLLLAGCRTVLSDTASNPDPRDAWGALECQVSDRHRHIRSGGDARPAADGSPANGSYRRLTVMDGDDFWGERCELGRNDHLHGPTALYREGMRRATLFSIRLPENFPLDASTWQTIMQMKQAQPSDAGGGVPILEMQAHENNFRVSHDKGTHWTYPAAELKGRWIRFLFDVTYSQDPTRGSLQVGMDTTGDGELDVKSPRISAQTLKTETDGPNGTSDGLAPGDPIPSHLRMGVYHNPSITCPAPTGCSIEIDNVQVMAP